MATRAKTRSVKAAPAKLTRTIKSQADRAADAVKNGPSPNPMTNLIIADVAMRGGGRLLRHVIERTLLGVKYTPDKARDIVKGRSMTQTLLGTAAARIATRSLPGALAVSGGLLAKALYDRSRKRRKARSDGEAAIDDQADNA